MAFTDELYEATRGIWDAQVQHPFVQGISNGTLDPEVFERWVRQDYLYLVEFSRVFAWAAARGDRLESMSWYAAALHLTLNTEMALHREYAARFGITAEELESEEMWPTTRAYTDFLVRTAADGDLADLVAALLPCAWGRRVPRGCRLAQVGDGSTGGRGACGEARAIDGPVRPVESLRVAVLGDVLARRDLGRVNPCGAHGGQGRRPAPPHPTRRNSPSQYLAVSV